VAVNLKFESSWGKMNNLAHSWL